MLIKTGVKAPEFSLFSSDSKAVSLSDYEGKNVVLLFFPLAFTSVCTTELCEMRDKLTTYNNLDAEVVAISVDSPFTLDRFKKDQQINFTLLSDFNKQVSRNYGCLYEEFVLEMRGVSKRSAFVLDKAGVVQYAEVLESAGDLPNFVAIQETLSSL